MTPYMEKQGGYFLGGIVGRGRRRYRRGGGGGENSPGGEVVAAPIIKVM